MAINVENKLKKKLEDRLKDIKAQKKAYEGTANHTKESEPDSRDRTIELYKIGKEVTKLEEEQEKVEQQMLIVPIANYLVYLGIEENGELPIEHMICRLDYQAHGKAIVFDASVYMNHELKDLGKNIRVKLIFDAYDRILLPAILSKEAETPFFKEDSEFQCIIRKESKLFVDGSSVVMNIVSEKDGFEPKFVHYRFDEKKMQYVEAHRFYEDESNRKRQNEYHQLSLLLNPFLGTYNGRLYNTYSAQYAGNLEFEKIVGYGLHPDDIPYMGHSKFVVRETLAPILREKRVLMGVDSFKISNSEDDALNVFAYLDMQGNIIGEKLFYIMQYHAKGSENSRGELKCIGVTNETYAETVNELVRQAKIDVKKKKEEARVSSKSDIINAVDEEHKNNLDMITNSFDVEPQKPGIKKKYTFGSGENHE